MNFEIHLKLIHAIRFVVSGLIPDFCSFADGKICNMTFLCVFIRSHTPG